MKKASRVSEQKKGESKAAVKHGTIADALRLRIVTQELLPGDQLPTRSVIEQEFGASSVTVQRALDTLIQDGFVHATRRRGTFVSQNPPHLSRYGLVFPIHAQQDPTHWTRFWSALCNEAISMRRPGECELEFYTGVDGHTDSVDYKRLEREVQSYRLAGLMLFLNPQSIAPILDLHPNLPRILVGGDEFSLDDTLVSLRLSTHSFVDKAFDYLVERGCRRIAIISHHGPDNSYNQLHLQAAHKRGLEIPPYWLQSSGLDVASSTRNMAHLLMVGPKSQRPQGLIITDDNLVEHATTGLAAAGIGAGDLEVVAHCNFPWPTPSLVPCKRLGYDSRHILETGIQMLNQFHNHQPQDVMLPAVFDEETQNKQSTSLTKNSQNVASYLKGSLKPKQLSTTHLKPSAALTKT